MSTVLKNLVRGPHGSIAVKAWMDWHNYISTQSLTEEQVRARIIKTMQGPDMTHREMREAIARGFAAARRTPEPPSGSHSEPAEDEVPLPKHGLAEARFIARSRRVFAQKRTAVAR
jgi:hypothetical protein